MEKLNSKVGKQVKKFKDRNGYDTVQIQNYSEDGKLHGTQIEYVDGNLFSIEFYKNGVKDGLFSYFILGKISSTKYYHNGILTDEIIYSLDQNDFSVSRIRNEKKFEANYDSNGENYDDDKIITAWD